MEVSSLYEIIHYSLLRAACIGHLSFFTQIFYAVGSTTINNEWYGEIERERKRERVGDRGTLGELDLVVTFVT